MDLPDDVKNKILTAVRMASSSAQKAVNIPLEDSSDDESSDEPFTPFNERPEWSDVSPLKQDEGQDPVAVIQYSDRFRNTFDYFRAILAKDERSKRAFDLTTECISLNPANYTVWYFRRVLLKDLGLDLKQELLYMDEVIEMHSKNYQVWHHRKCIVEMMSDDAEFSPGFAAKKEKKFTGEILEVDSKNYHAWQHRQWMVSFFKEWEGELEYTNNLIEDDVRNNSAWNHRHFVITNTTGFIDEVIDRELNYVMAKITLATFNESPWNYLRGILEPKGLLSKPRVTAFCEDLFSSPSNDKSPHLVGFIIDSLEERLEAGERVMTDENILEKAVNLCNLLALKWDPIRVNYWNFIRDSLREKYAENKEESK